MIRVPGHVLDVAVQAHAGIEKHGDGRPGAVREAGPEKAVHGDAGFPQARRVRDADHAPVPEQPQRCVPLIGPWPHRSGADHRSSNFTRLASEGSSVAFRQANSMLSTCQHLSL